MAFIVMAFIVMTFMVLRRWVPMSGHALLLPESANSVVSVVSFLHVSRSDEAKYLVVGTIYGWPVVELCMDGYGNH